MTPRLTRRDFLSSAGIGTAALTLAARSHAQAANSKMRIRTAQLAEPIQCPKSSGDLWTAAWADDGDLNVASDDTSAFDRACSSKLAISRLAGPTRLIAGSYKPLELLPRLGIAMEVEIRNCQAITRLVKRRIELKGVFELVGCLRVAL